MMDRQQCLHAMAENPQFTDYYAFSTCESRDGARLKVSWSGSAVGRIKFSI